MGNHLHVVVRTRPDLAARWSDEDIGRRWWRLFPRRRDAQGQPADPEPHEWSAKGGLVAEPAACSERRRRLASLSWFMRALCEPIARRANREDQCSGRFFEGRFKCQALLDEAAVLACSVYVDLNPIRAGLADRPERLEFTSAYDRISARQAHQQLAAGRAPRPAGRDGKRVHPQAKKKAASSVSAEADARLCGFAEERAATARSSRAEAAAPPAPAAAAGRRASDRGFLSMTLDCYLSLLDWTGRQMRRDKRGAIPDELARILTRLQVGAETWLESVQHFGRRFGRAVGAPAQCKPQPSGPASAGFRAWRIAAWPLSEPREALCGCLGPLGGDQQLPPAVAANLRFRPGTLRSNCWAAILFGAVGGV